MNKYIIFVSIFIISLIYSVTCDDSEEVKRFGLNTARQSYRFNHPPAAEDYRTIPVAVVYDKVIDRTNRRQKLVKPVTESEAKGSTPVPKDAVILSNVPKNIIGEKVTTTETSVNATEISTENISKPESRDIKLTLKIPVSVVYDDEPGFVKTNRINSGVSTRLRKTGKRQRKPITETDEQTVITIKPFYKNESQLISDVKPVNNILEKASLSKSSQAEKPKTDLNESKTRTRNLRRRPQTKKPDSNIVKVSSENATQQKFEQITQTQISKSNVLKENRDQEKPRQIQITESKNTNVPAENGNQETPNNVLKPEIKISNVSTKNEPKKQREHGEPDPVVPIVASENLVYGNTGEFKYSYEGGDGTRAFSKGKLKSFDENVAGESVEGGFSYNDKDGNNISLSYTADENGYRPVGAHLPTPPPIPPAIARALAYLATKTTPEPVTEPINEQEENTPAPRK